MNHTMNYELDDLDYALLALCRRAIIFNDMKLLDEDDFRKAIELLIKLTDNSRKVRWPYRYRYIIDIGYVIWKDVFENQPIPYSLDVVAQKLKIAVFVVESEAADYCRYVNELSRI